MRFFVTGATGLVGSHVVESILARKHSVRTLVRRPADAEELRTRGVEVSMGDLSDESALRSFVDGSDTIVHCAGAVDIAGTREALWEVNVRGTERLIAAGVHANVSRFVHVSSVAVYGDSPVPVREDAPKNPAGAYGASKWEAEKIVERYRRESNSKAVILRPCAIYGERDRHAQRALDRIVRLPVIPLARGGGRLLDLVHASDVATAILSAARADDAPGRAYNITDGERHTHRDIVMTMGRVAGKRPWILSLPGPAFAALETLQRWLGYVSAGGGRRLGRLRALDVDLHYDIEAARRDLCYRPRVPLEEGLRRAFDSMSGDSRTQTVTAAPTMPR